MIIPLPYRIGFGLIVALILGVGLAIFKEHYQDLQAAALQNAARGTVLENTSGIIADAEEADVQMARVDVVVSDARITYERQLEKVKRDDPTFAARGADLRDDRLRQFARERRLSRERLGRAEVGTEETIDSGTAAER